MRIEADQLDFFAPHGVAPEISQSEVDDLIARLRGKGWQNARHLCASGRESEKRKIRALAEASEGRIISGQDGYKLTIEATLEEINATSWLKHQGEKMIQRYLDIQRIRHKHR